MIISPSFFFFSFCLLPFCFNFLFVSLRVLDALSFVVGVSFRFGLDLLLIDL